MNITYTVRVSDRARALRISVEPGGAVVVVAPRFSNSSMIARFVARFSHWIEKQVRVAKGRCVIRFTRSDIAMLKKRAREIAETRASHFAKLYGVTFQKIAIRAQKCRWGSCSHKGNLSFNYKIAALPAHLSDYIIVHELCHLIEPNHSKRFWRLVASAIPNHKDRRKELRNIFITFR